MNLAPVHNSDTSDTVSAFMIMGDLSIIFAGGLWESVISYRVSSKRVIGSDSCAWNFDAVVLQQVRSL